jgi:hypothetical protein
VEEGTDQGSIDDKKRRGTLCFTTGSVITGYTDREIRPISDDLTDFTYHAPCENPSPSKKKTTLFVCAGWEETKRERECDIPDEESDLEFFTDEEIDLTRGIQIEKSDNEES